MKTSGLDVVQDGVGGERGGAEQARGLGQRGEGDGLEEVGGAAGEADAAHLGPGRPAARAPERGRPPRRGRELGQAQHPDDQPGGHGQAGEGGGQRRAGGAELREAEVAADQQPVERDVERRLATAIATRPGRGRPVPSR